MGEIGFMFLNHFWALTYFTFVIIGRWWERSYTRDLLNIVSWFLKSYFTHFAYEKFFPVNGELLIIYKTREGLLWRKNKKLFISRINQDVNYINITQFQVKIWEIKKSKGPYLTFFLKYEFFYHIFL